MFHALASAALGKAEVTNLHMILADEHVFGLEVAASAKSLPVDDSLLENLDKTIANLSYDLDGLGLRDGPSLFD